MDLSYRSTLMRWATAAFAAAGAITFVATDGHSNMRRLIVSLFSQPAAGGQCNFSDGTSVVGTGQAFDGNGALVCDVNISAATGSTNTATQRCPPSPFVNAPSYTFGQVRRINMSSGDVQETICTAPNGWWSGWPNSSTCSATYAANGCSYSLNTWGVQ